MKINALVAAAVLFAGMTSGAYAECDTHKGDRDTDKQTACTEKCEDGYSVGIQTYNANIAKVTETAKACFEKCGCTAYGDAFLARDRK
jgi:hypothetical protein